MAKEMTEIRWHGRGGQGAKTAAQLVAQVAMGEDEDEEISGVYIWGVLAVTFVFVGVVFFLSTRRAPVTT